MKTTWQMCFTLSVLSLYQSSCSARVLNSAVRNKTIKLGLAQAQANDVSTTRQQRKQLQSPNISGIEPRTLPAAHRALGIHSYLPDVFVTCAASDFVVRVNPSFYGFGADASELKLGTSCKSNGVLAPHGDLLFTYPLTACDSTRELTPAYLIYKFRLHYVPSPKRLPLRAHAVHVEIECHYQRNHHVYQLTVQPTWETTVVRKGLKGSPNDFKMELMDESWSHKAESPVYQPGETVHIQVSAPQMPAGGKLYIKNCYATPSTDAESSKKYTIIDNYGCLLDNKRDLGASRFVSRTDKMLRFSLKAFQFISDPDTEMSIHCHLFATSDDPGPSHKSCSYTSGRWTALRGDDAICQCCDSHCITAKNMRDVMSGSTSSELLVSDEPQSEADGFLTVSQPGMDQTPNNQDELPSPAVWRDSVTKQIHKGEVEESDMEPVASRERSDPEEGSGFEEGFDTRSDVHQLNSKCNHSRKKSLSLGDAAGADTPEERRDTGPPAGDDQELTWYFTWT